MEAGDLDIAEILTQIFQEMGPNSDNQLTRDKAIEALKQISLSFSLDPEATKVEGEDDDIIEFLKEADKGQTGLISLEDFLQAFKTLGILK